MKAVDYKVQGGKMLKIKLILDGEIIKSVTILGDFFLHPESTIEAIEESLTDLRIDVEQIAENIQCTLDYYKAVLIGAKPLDIAKAIEKATISE